MTADTHDDEHDRGLGYDLSTLTSRFAGVPAAINRRQLMGLFAGAGVLAVAGCGSSRDTTSSVPTTTASASATASTAAADCVAIPEETGGPYPAVGSNGPNVLAESGIVRSDIRSSFGASTAVAQGVPLTVKLTVQELARGCAAFAGAAIYLWHCDREGRYSLYSPGVTDQNYLRGVQAADKNGRVSFTSIFPAAYSGRWPHIHFEVYPSLAKATSAGSRLRTSQLALPKAACDLVYATAGYEQSVQNLAQTSLERDMVFSDGYAQQLATMSGSGKKGMTAELVVRV